MTIGRRPSKRVGIPNNRTMSVRANAHLENYAISKGEHFETSLGVDAPYFYFWYKTNGSIPCSCTSSSSGFDSAIDAGGENPLAQSRLGTTQGRSTVYEGAEAQDLDKLFELSSSDPLSKVVVKPKIPRVEDKVFDTYDTEDDIDETLEAIEDEPDGLTDFNDPFNLFSDKAIQCPICLDSGYIDGWNLNNGNRCVFDTSNYHHFHCDNVDIDAMAQPTQLHANEGGKVYWSLKLPRIWLDIIRVEVYNGSNKIDRDLYTWQWVNKDNSGDTGPVTRESLNDQNDLGKILRLILTFNVEIDFTHAEIIFVYRSPYKAQLPEVTQGYEEEFLDWNVSLTAELPPSVQIKEGNYLTESKYSKVWKVSTVTPKVTAGGNVFGISAELRALHSFEKKYQQLSLFKKTRVNINVSTPPSGAADTDNYVWTEKDW